MTTPHDPGSRVPAHIRRLGKVHHVAVVVRDIDDSLGFWRDMLGLPVDLYTPIFVASRPALASIQMRTQWMTDRTDEARLTRRRRAARR